MKKKILLGCALMFLCACTSTRSSVMNVQEPRAIAVQEYRPSIVEVRNAIFSGVHAAKWRAQDRAPGLIYATQRWRGSTVTLEIDYTATSYAILYKDCTDDDYNAASGNVPTDFPRWVAFLAKNIDEKVAVLGIEAQTEIKAFPRIAPSLPGEPVTLDGTFEETEEREETGIVTRFDDTNKASVLVQNSEPESSTTETPAVRAEPADETELVQEKELAPSSDATKVQPAESVASEPTLAPVIEPAPEPELTPAPTPVPVTEPTPEPVTEPTPVPVTESSVQDLEQEQSTQKSSRTTLGKSVLTPLPTAREQEVHVPAPQSSQALVQEATPQESAPVQPTPVVTSGATPAATSGATSGADPAMQKDQALEPKVTRAIPVHLVMPSAETVKQENVPNNSTDNSTDKPTDKPTDKQETQS